jgi:hypothetical protein
MGAGMRIRVGLILAAALLLAGCQSQPRTPATPETVAGSFETSAGLDTPADDPSLSHVDSRGREPADDLSDHVDAINSRDWELVYSLLANPGVDFDLFKHEAEEAQESYEDFEVHETRVINPALALVRVTYYAETTPSEGQRYPILIEEPGEWWRIEMVDGMWKVGWLARQ